MDRVGDVNFIEGAMMKSKAILALLLALTAVVAGCNTVSGVGKDIQAGGEKIQGAANH